MRWYDSSRARWIHLEEVLCRWSGHGIQDEKSDGTGSSCAKREHCIWWWAEEGWRWWGHWANRGFGEDVAGPEATSSLCTLLTQNPLIWSYRTQRVRSLMSWLGASHLEKTACRSVSSFFSCVWDPRRKAFARGQGPFERYAVPRYNHVVGFCLCSPRHTSERRVWRPWGMQQILVHQPSPRGRVATPQHVCCLGAWPGWSAKEEDRWRGGRFEWDLSWGSSRCSQGMSPLMPSQAKSNAKHGRNSFPTQVLISPNMCVLNQITQAGWSFCRSTWKPKQPFPRAAPWTPMKATANSWAWAPPLISPCRQNTLLCSVEASVSVPLWGEIGVNADNAAYNQKRQRPERPEVPKVVSVVRRCPRWQAREDIRADAGLNWVNTCCFS